MKILYSAKLIKAVTMTHQFDTYSSIVELGGTNLPYKDLVFVKKDKLDLFLNFVEKLVFLSKEFRLDYISHLEIDIDEVCFLEELDISNAASSLGV